MSRRRRGRGGEHKAAHTAASGLREAVGTSKPVALGPDSPPSAHPWEHHHPPGVVGRGGPAPECRRAHGSTLAGCIAQARAPLPGASTDPVASHQRPDSPVPGTLYQRRVSADHCCSDLLCTGVNGEGQQPARPPQSEMKARPVRRRSRFCCWRRSVSRARSARRARKLPCSDSGAGGSRGSPRRTQ